MIKITKTQYWDFERQVKQGYTFQNQTLDYRPIRGGNCYQTSETGKAVGYRDLVGYYLLSEVFLDIFGNGNKN